MNLETSSIDLFLFAQTNSLMALQWKKIKQAIKSQETVPPTQIRSPQFDFISGANKTMKSHRILFRGFQAQPTKICTMSKIRIYLHFHLQKTKKIFRKKPWIERSHFQYLMQLHLLFFKLNGTAIRVKQNGNSNETSQADDRLNIPWLSMNMFLKLLKYWT